MVLKQSVPELDRKDRNRRSEMIIRQVVSIVDVARQKRSPSAAR
jgi:hypothetical protein